MCVYEPITLPSLMQMSYYAFLGCRCTNDYAKPSDQLYVRYLYFKAKALKPGSPLAAAGQEPIEFEQRWPRAARGTS